MSYQILASAEHGINWDGLAADYRNAKTEEEQDEAFEMIVQCVAEGLPKEADEVEGATTFLQDRGLWMDWLPYSGVLNPQRSYSLGRQKRRPGPTLRKLSGIPLWGCRIAAAWIRQKGELTMNQTIDAYAVLKREHDGTEASERQRCTVTLSGAKLTVSGPLELEPATAGMMYVAIIAADDGRELLRLGITNYVAGGALWESDGILAGPGCRGAV